MFIDDDKKDSFKLDTSGSIRDIMRQLMPRVANGKIHYKQAIAIVELARTELKEVELRLEAIKVLGIDSARTRASLLRIAK